MKYYLKILNIFYAKTAHAHVGTENISNVLVRTRYNNIKQLYRIMKIYKRAKVNILFLNIVKCLFDMFSCTIFPNFFSILLRSIFLNL